MSSSQNTAGMAFEAMVTNMFMQELGCVLHENSRESLNYRKSLIHKLPTETQDELYEQAQRLTVTVPELSAVYGWDIVPGSVIEIVQDESGRSKVYDLLIFTESRPEPFELSVKTNHTVEDKSYRFNTKWYAFPAVNDYVNSVVGDNPQGSWEDVLHGEGVTVSDFLSNVTDSMVYTVGDPSTPDYEMLSTLTSERFIGDGGYAKTLSGGGTRWYPERPSGNPEIRNVVKTRPSTFTYDAVYSTDEGYVTYTIDFRVKFKDGKSKPVRINTQGAPANLSATVRILGITDRDFNDIL